MTAKHFLVVGLFLLACGGILCVLLGVLSSAPQREATSVSAFPQIAEAIAGASNNDPEAPATEPPLAGNGAEGSRADGSLAEERPSPPFPARYRDTVEKLRKILAEGAGKESVKAVVALLTDFSLELADIDTEELSEYLAAVERVEPVELRAMLVMALGFNRTDRVRTWLREQLLKQADQVVLSALVTAMRMRRADDPKVLAWIDEQRSRLSATGRRTETLTPRWVVSYFWSQCLAANTRICSMLKKAEATKSEKWEIKDANLAPRAPRAPIWGGLRDQTDIDAIMAFVRRDISDAGGVQSTALWLLPLSALKGTDLLAYTLENSKSDTLRDNAIMLIRPSIVLEAPKGLKDIALGDPNQKLRAEAAYALGLYASPEIDQVLLNIFHDAGPGFDRALVIQSLTNPKRTHLLPEVHQWMRDNAANSPADLEMYVQNLYIWHLQDHIPQADLLLWARHPKESVRCQVLRVLGLIWDVPSIRELEWMATSDPSEMIREYAKSELARSPEERARQQSYRPDENDEGWIIGPEEE